MQNIPVEKEVQYTKRSQKFREHFKYQNLEVKHVFPHPSLYRNNSTGRNNGGPSSWPFAEEGGSWSERAKVRTAELLDLNPVNPNGDPKIYTTRERVNSWDSTKTAWMKMMYWNLPFSLRHHGKVSAGDVSKERYKDFGRSPFWVTYVNVNSKSASYFVGKQFLGTFPSTNSCETTGDLLEIFWKELGLTKLSVIGQCLLDVVFSKWPKNFVLYFVWEISSLFQLGVPHDLIWRA